MSGDRLREHRRIWERKPELAVVYEPWFAWLVGGFPEGARVLEVGAGPGFLAEFARRARPDVAWVTSELLAVPWNDVAADAGRLPFRTGSFDAVAAFDTLHHLPGLRRFFEEAARVLRPGAPLRTVEPWVTPLSFPLYRWFHQEGCTLGLDPWGHFDDVPGKQPFDGDAAVAHRLCSTTSDATWRELGWGRPTVRRMNGFAYVPSLGFRDGSLAPPWLARVLNGVDRLTAPLSPLAAFRGGIEWRRLRGGSTPPG